MGLRSRTLACAATRARQTQTTTSCLQHLSGLYRSHGRVVGDPEVMRRNLSLCIANALTDTGFSTDMLDYRISDFGPKSTCPVSAVVSMGRCNTFLKFTRRSLKT